jgi:methionyl-tRNA formyltransferase
MYSVIFMATPDFAVPCLRMLVASGYDVKGVVTQPDKPKGRGQHLAFSPVKECALELGLDVFQPAKARDGQLLKYLTDKDADVIITAAYGKILPPAVLGAARLGGINVHASILPKYRGPAPIQYAIINDETKSGITIIHMDEGMDTGDIITIDEVDITGKMTGGDLHDALAKLGADTLERALQIMMDDEKNGTSTRFVQNHDDATYAPMLTKQTGKINWSKSAKNIYNLVRAVNPWPVAFSEYEGLAMKIWECEITDESSDGIPAGRICKASGGEILIASGDYIMKILCLQFPSSKKMLADEYLRGHSLKIDSILE